MTTRQRAIIVLVEDDPGHARLVEKNLRKAHIENEIVVLPDGQMASDYLFCEGSYAECRRPQSLLILLDLHLPKIDGYELLTRIKSDPATRRIPVVVLTSADEAHDVARCYQLGCSAFITKPRDDSDFSEAIRKLGVFLALMAGPPL